jgi:hypothetical protein
LHPDATDALTEALQQIPHSYRDPVQRAFRFMHDDRLNGVPAHILRDVVDVLWRALEIATTPKPDAPGGDRCHYYGSVCQQSEFCATNRRCSVREPSALCCDKVMRFTDGLPKGLTHADYCPTTPGQTAEFAENGSRNPHLPEDYVRRLAELPKATRDRFRSGAFTYDELQTGSVVGCGPGSEFWKESGGSVEDLIETKPTCLPDCDVATSVVARGGRVTMVAHAIGCPNAGDPGERIVFRPPEGYQGEVPPPVLWTRENAAFPEPPHENLSPLALVKNGDLPADLILGQEEPAAEPTKRNPFDTRPFPDCRPSCVSTMALGETVHVHANDCPNGPPPLKREEPDE